MRCDAPPPDEHLSARAVGELDLRMTRLRKLVRIIEREVKAARLLASACALDDEVRDQREITQLDEIARHLEVDVVLADLVAQDLDPAASALEALVGPHDAHVRP